MRENWTDLNKSGKRLDKIIKKLYKNFRDTKNIDKRIRLANSISVLTNSMVGLAKIELGIDEAYKEFKARVITP